MLVLVIGAVVVGGQIEGAYPRDVTVRYAVPPGIEELRIAYLSGDAEVTAVRIDHPSDVVRDEVSLSPGRYRIEAVLRREGDSRLLTRALRVPSEGQVRIDLRTQH